MQPDAAGDAKMLEFIAQHTSDVFTRIDRSGVVTYASPSIRAYGYEPSDVVGTTGLQLFHPDDREHVAQNLRDLLEGDGSPSDRTHRFLKPDGEVIWIEGNPTLVRGPDGEVIEFVNVFRDVTARREAEAARLNSESRNRQIAEKTADVIAISDAAGLITFMSPSIRRLGFEPEELIGKTFTPYTHPDDVGPMRECLRRQRRGGETARVRWRALNKLTGEWVWQESAPSRLWDEVTGEAIGFLDVVRDISDQVRQEEALSEARAAAEEAARVKAQFLANMSHEIRTPLTAVLGFTGLLQESACLDEAARGHVHRIATAGSALLAIVNDILDFSKLEAGRIELRPRPTDVAVLARDTLALFAAGAEGKGLTLNVEVADPPPLLELDADRLRQVLVNLVGNAVKFTETGGATVRVGLADEGRTLRIAVEDTGPGLDAQQCAQLFQRFNQIDGSTTRRHGGTGLGLAICKGLVEAMGGGIGVESAPGRGSTFFLTLPAIAAEAAPEAEAPEALSVAGLRVMVVDDNPMNRELARRILQALGVEASDAVGGAEALEQLACLPVDAVLMDLRMPGVDGREALRRLRAGAGPNADVPVLAFTADAEVGDGAGLDAFDGVVRKPIAPLDLVARLAAATSRPRTGRLPESRRSVG